MSRRITLIRSVSTPGNEWRIVRNLHHVLSKTVPVRMVDCGFTGLGFRGAFSAIFRQIKSAARSDVVIIHSPFLLAFPSAITAWLLRKRLIAFAWDSYPTKIAGRYYDRRFSRRMADVPEILVPWLTSRTVIPTSDFCIDPKFRNAEVISFWAAAEQKVPDSAVPRTPGKHRKIAFSGQINETRGVLEALRHLDRILTDRAEIHLFSNDLAENIMLVHFNNLELYHHGFLPHDQMIERMREIDFGLVSLHPELETPGFPSKTLDYLSASLPVIYFGRSLPAYTGLLESSGVGIDISAMGTLDLEKLAELRTQMTKAREKFASMICAEAGAFDHLFKEVDG